MEGDFGEKSFFYFLLLLLLLLAGLGATRTCIPEPSGKPQGETDLSIPTLGNPTRSLIF